jgi:hypothetical protein
MNATSSRSYHHGPPYIPRYEQRLSICSIETITIFGLSGLYVWDLSMIEPPYFLSALGNTAAPAEPPPRVLSIKLSDPQKALVRRLAHQNDVWVMRLAVDWQQTFHSAPKSYCGLGLQELGRLCVDVPVVEAYCGLAWDPAGKGLSGFSTPVEVNGAFISDLETLWDLIFDEDPGRDWEGEEINDFDISSTFMAVSHWKTNFPWPKPGVLGHTSTSLVATWGRGKRVVEQLV